MGATKLSKGQRFNQLTVVSLISNPPRDLRALCKCDCGKLTEVITNNLRNGHTKSCGCHRLEVLRQGQSRKTHGMTKSPEFRAWRSMQDRCYNKNVSNYSRYGGRGIRVCDRWIESFSNFYADMGPRPSKHTLDRIDNNGNYEPSNCRWATMVTQRSNDSRVMLLNYKGETMPLNHWAKRIKMHQATLRQRIVELGWPVEEAIETPTNAYRSRGRH